MRPLRSEPDEGAASTLLVVGPDGALQRLPLIEIERRGMVAVRAANDATLGHAISALAPRAVVVFAQDEGDLTRLADLRRRGARTFPPVLVIYGGDAPSAFAQAEETGADDLLFEPYEPYELGLRLDVLERIRGLRAALVQSHERLKALTLTDELTGLLKQGEFRRRLEVEIRRIRRFRIPVACVFFDCDHFKAVNDTYGHEAGSYVLREVARLVAENLRETDIVGRYGGDEFVIGMPGCGAFEATAVANRLAAMVRAHVFVSGQAKIKVTLSLGVAAATPEAPCTGDELLQAADQALYEAKRRGRDQAVTAGLPAPDAPPRA